jgi:hypothetical protein
MWIDWSDFLLQVAPSNPKSDWILTELVDSTEMVPDAYPDHRKSPQWRPSKCLRTGEHGGVLAGLGPNSGVKMPKRWKIRYGWAMRHPWVNLCYVFDWTIWGWDFDSYPNDVLIPDDTVLVCFFFWLGSLKPREIWVGYGLSQVAGDEEVTSRQITTCTDWQNI